MGGHGGYDDDDDLEYCEDDEGSYGDVEDSGEKAYGDEKDYYKPSGAAPAAESAGGCSTPGQMTCSGTGFNTCDNGKNVYRDCAPGTACRPFNGAILCDWPQNK
jgi:hypothetical protein